MGRISIITYLFLFCVSLSSSTPCDGSQVQIHVYESMNRENGTLWWILRDDEGKDVYQSNMTTTVGKKNYTACITASNFYQYSLFPGGKALDKSSLEIYNDDGGRVFMFPHKGEEFTLSLFQPIMKAEKWQWRNTYEHNWYSEDNPTGEWHLENTPNTEPSTCFYFRKQFTFINCMAAYEVRFLYKSGIVAYLQGVEIYRDNMAPGPVIRDSKPTNSYPNSDYRGTIRNGYGDRFDRCSSTNYHTSRFLYVEVHIEEEELAEFHAWLSFYASSRPVRENDHCYILPIDQITGSNSTVNPNYIYDYDYQNTYVEFSPQNTEYVEFAIPTAQLNAFSFYFRTTSPLLEAFSISFRHEFDGESLFSLSTSTEFKNNGTVYLDNPGIPNSRLVRYQRYSPGLTSSTVFISELHLYVCNSKYTPELSSPDFRSKYTLGLNRNELICPHNHHLFTCQFGKGFPKGLVVKNCSIIGTPTKCMEPTDVILYYHDVWGTRSMTIRFEVTKTVIHLFGVNFSYGEVLITLVICIVVVILVFCGYCCMCKKKHEKTSQGTVDNTTHAGEFIHLPSTKSTTASPLSSSSHQPVSIELTECNKERPVTTGSDGTSISNSSGLLPVSSDIIPNRPSDIIPNRPSDIIPNQPSDIIPGHITNGTSRLSQPAILNTTYIHSISSNSFNHSLNEKTYNFSNSCSSNTYSHNPIPISRISDSISYSGKKMQTTIHESSSLSNTVRVTNPLPNSGQYFNLNKQQSHHQQPNRIPPPPPPQQLQQLQQSQSHHQQPNRIHPPPPPQLQQLQQSQSYHQQHCQQLLPPSSQSQHHQISQLPPYLSQNDQLANLIISNTLPSSSANHKKWNTLPPNNQADHNNPDLMSTLGQGSPSVTSISPQPQPNSQSQQPEVRTLPSNYYFSAGTMKVPKRM